MFRKVVKRMTFIHTFLIKLTNLIQIRLTPDPKTVDFAILQDMTYSDVSNRSNILDLRSDNKFLLMEIVKTLFQPIDFHSYLIFIFGIFDLFFILLFLFKIPALWAATTVDWKYNIFKNTYCYCFWISPIISID